MKSLSICAAACVALACMAVPAYAQTVPWGDGVAEVGAAVVPTVKDTLTLIIMGVIIKFAGPFGMLIRQNYVSELVGKAVDFAYGATFGAVRGQVLTVDQMPEFLKNVVLYANGHFPWVLRFIIKNVRGLVEMALARVVQEIPADFRYTPAMAVQIEHETGGPVKISAPLSALGAKFGLVGA